MHVAEEEVRGGEVGVEDVQGGFEGGVEAEGGDLGCERGGGGFAWGREREAGGGEEVGGDLGEGFKVVVVVVVVVGGGGGWV